MVRWKEDLFLINNRIATKEKKETRYCDLRQLNQHCTPSMGILRWNLISIHTPQFIRDALMCLLVYIIITRISLLYGSVMEYICFSSPEYSEGTPS